MPESKDLMIAWDTRIPASDRTLPVFKCVFCKNRIFTKPVFSKSANGSWVLSGEAAFHFHSTHGYDPETFLYMYEEILRRVSNAGPTSTQHATTPDPSN